jgi:hypothetical protein
MTFLNPWLLAGIAAIAAPIVIHMMMRRVRRMKWAAMRFLQVAVQRQERKLRIEDRLLLLLRCLLLILLALALARPAFRAAGMAAGGGPRIIVLAIDNSEGMGLTDGGASRFDNARKAAEQIVDALPPGSSAALILYSDVARAVIDEPATDLNLVRGFIRQAPLTDRASNAHPALLAAWDILRRHASGHGDIYLITGAQAAGWTELAAMRPEAAQTGAHIVVVVPGPGEQPNLGIDSIGLGSAMLPVGAAVRFGIEAGNYGKEEARNVPVGLSIDGQAPSDQAVIPALAPGESRWVSLYAKFDRAGYHSVTGILPADHLAADDRRTMVVRAVDEIHVLLVAGDTGATPGEGDPFFLERAIAPVAPEDRDRYFIRTRTITPDELDSVRIADFDAVGLVDVPSLEPQTVSQLEKYVGDGGGVMIFPGEKTSVPFYNTMLGEGSGLLPALFGPPWGDAADETKFRSLQASDYTHPMVSIWQDPAAGTLASARFFKGLSLQPLPKQSPKAGDTEIILAYQDGSPAIVERRWGKGRVLQFSSTANSAWNDLPARPAFVPLIQRALGRLVTTRDQTLNIRAGAAFTYPAQPDWLYKRVTVTPPLPGAAAGETAIRLVAGEPLLRYADTDHAGLYQVAIDSDPPAKLAFAVQPDPAESDLTPVSDADLKSLAPETAVVHWTSSLDVRQALAWAGNGREFWTVLAVLALGVACCESYLAGRFSASK